MPPPWPGLPKGVFLGGLFLLGIGGGLFIVPVAAVLQHRLPAERKGPVQGTASWLSWIGIFVVWTRPRALPDLFGRWIGRG